MKNIRRIFMSVLLLAVALISTKVYANTAIWVEGGFKYKCPEEAPYRYQKTDKCFKYDLRETCPEGFSYDGEACLKEVSRTNCKKGETYKYNGKNVCAYTATRKATKEKRTGVFKKEETCSGTNIVKSTDEYCYSCPTGYDTFEYIASKKEVKCIFTKGEIFNKCPEGLVLTGEGVCVIKKDITCPEGTVRMGNNCQELVAAAKTTDPSPTLTKECKIECESESRITENKYSTESCISNCLNKCEKKCDNPTDDTCISPCAREAVRQFKFNGKTDIYANQYVSHDDLDEPTSTTSSSINVEKISLSDNKITIGEKQTHTLVATVTPTNATIKSVKWSSSNTSIAEVDSNGVVKGIKKGTATITARAKDSSGVSAKCTVTVTNKTIIQNITLTDLSVKNKRKAKIKVKYEPSNPSNKKLSWKSSDPTIATVDGDGEVKGKKEGTVTITATAKDDGKKSATCNVTVTKLEALTIEDSTKALRISNINEKQTLKYTYDEGETVVFESTNTDIATVNKKGVVTGKKLGTASIIAYYDGDRSSQVSRKVIVGNQIEELTTSNSMLAFKVGETKQIKMNVKPFNIANSSLTYLSMDPSIATVDKKGNVKALKEGNTTITINTRDGSRKEAYVLIYVSKDGKYLPKTNPMKDVKNLTFSKKVMKIEKDQTEKIVITSNPSNINEVDLEWHSKDDSIAKVNNKGEVTGVNSGKIMIYAIYNNGYSTGGVKKIVGMIRVDVSVIKVKSITLKPNKKTIKPGNTVQINIKKINPSNATKQTVKWTSSNESVATVDSKGLVKGIKDGTAHIYATARDGSAVSAIANITVSSNDKKSDKKSNNKSSKKSNKKSDKKSNKSSKKNSGKTVKAKSIAFTKETIKIAKNSNGTLVVNFTPAKVTNKKLTFTSSDTNIVTVDSKGVILTKNYGTATITAKTTDGSNKTATCTIKVMDIKVASITMDSKMTVKVGKKKTLKVNYFPDSAKTKKVTWSSSDKSVATVNKKGVVKGIKKGTAIITAKTTDGGEETASCKVKVKAKKSSKNVNSNDYKKQHQGEKIYDRRIYIGDSRTVGMHNAVGNKSTDIWSAKSSQGYSWMVSTGIPNVSSRVTSTTAVIFLMGVNDLHNVDKYASTINSYAKTWTKKGAKVYFVSVNPVNETKCAKNGYSVKNSQIDDFNSKIKSSLSKNVTYINTRSNLGFETTDGVHYDTNTYKAIYEYINKQIQK